MKRKHAKPSRRSGVLFSTDAHGQRQDKHLHAELLPVGAAVADEIAIRLLMKTGLTHDEACRLIGGGSGSIE